MDKRSQQKIIMKKYIKFELKNTHRNNYRYTVSDQSTKKLQLLSAIIISSSPSILLYCISEPNYPGHGSELIEYEIEGENIVIKASEEHFEDDGERFIMKFKDFKKMVIKWKELYEKQVPEIYFIFEDDGSITVQDHLEEDETNN